MSISLGAQIALLSIQTRRTPKKSSGLNTVARGAKSAFGRQQIGQKHLIDNHIDEPNDPSQKSNSPKNGGGPEWGDRELLPWRCFHWATRRATDARAILVQSPDMPSRTNQAFPNQNVVQFRTSVLVA